jgi:hypothetical protein
MKVHTRLLVSGGLVVAMAGAAVGSVATSASAHPKVKAAALPVASSPVTTTSFTFSASVSGLAKNATVGVTGSGQADFTNHLASVSITLPAGVAKFIPGSGSGPVVVNVVLSGGTVYAQIPGLSMLTGEPWISLALPSGATSVLPHGYATVASALGNVNEILNFATSKHAKVKGLGPSTVDGQSVTGDQITGAIKGVHIGVDLFTGSSGDLVRAQASIGKGSLGAKAQIDFSGDNSPVSITVPPSSEVKAIPLSLVERVLGSFAHKAGHHKAAHKA